MRPILKHRYKERFIRFEILRLQFAENAKKGAMLQEKFSTVRNFLIKRPLQC